MAQHDYDIANASGAVVRSDLNSVLAAVVSNNSGATAPSTTFAFMWWYDTANGLLFIRNAANTAWIGVSIVPPTDPIDFAESTANVAATVESETVVSVTVPDDGGTYHIAVDGYVHGKVETNGANNNSGSVTAEIDEDVDGGGFAVTNVAMMQITRPGAGDIDYEDAVAVSFDRAAPTAGSTYSYRLSPTVATNGSGAAALNAAAGRPHRIRVQLIRVA